MKEKITTTIRITPKVKEKLNFLSNALGLNYSSVISVLINIEYKTQYDEFKQSGLDTSTLPDPNCLAEEIEQIYQGGYIGM